jgi:hypothetical protein
MRRLALILAFLVILALAGSLALARSGYLAIPWFTVGGGGAASSGADYALSGTAGQTATGEMSGGQFTIGGGYWTGLSPPASEDGDSLYLPVIIK